jgi:hypothetical protein
VNVPAALVRFVSATTVLEPRRTRSATRTRARGFTTTVATRWPATRRTETLAAGGVGVGETCGEAGVGVTGAGGGAVPAGGGGLGGGGGGGGAVEGAFTVSTWVTAGCPASTAETVGDPGVASP